MRQSLQRHFFGEISLILVAVLIVVPSISYAQSGSFSGLEECADSPQTRDRKEIGHYYELCRACGWSQNCKRDTIMLCIQRTGSCETETICKQLGEVQVFVDGQDMGFVSCNSAASGSPALARRKLPGLGNDERLSDTECRDGIVAAGSACRSAAQRVQAFAQIIRVVNSSNNQQSLQRACQSMKSAGGKSSAVTSLAASECNAGAAKCKTACEVAGSNQQKTTCDDYFTEASRLASQSINESQANSAASKCQGKSDAVKPVAKKGSGPLPETQSEKTDPDQTTAEQDTTTEEEEEKKEDGLYDANAGNQSNGPAGMPDLSSLMGGNEQPYQEQSYGCQYNPNSPECMNCDLNPDGPGCPEKEKENREQGKMMFGRQKDDSSLDDYNVKDLTNVPRDITQRDPGGTGPAIQNATVANNTGGSIPGQGGGAPPATQGGSGSGGFDKPYNISNLEQGFRSGGGYTYGSGGEADRSSRYNRRGPANTGGGSDKDKINLQSYLPGGANDPRRFAGGVSGRSREIVPAHVSMWEMHATRISVHCKVNGYKDCGTPVSGVGP